MPGIHLHRGRHRFVLPDHTDALRVYQACNIRRRRPRSSPLPPRRTNPKLALQSAHAAVTPATSPPCGTLQYEVYLTVPNPMAGDLTISVTAQLKSGPSAANWGISLYNFLDTVDDYTTSVPLTGGEILSVVISCHWPRDCVVCVPACLPAVHRTG